MGKKAYEAKDERQKLSKFRDLRRKRRGPPSVPPLPVNASQASLDLNGGSEALEAGSNGSQVSERGTTTASSRSESILLRACRTCKIIIFIWITIAVASLGVGLWRSFATGDEGKGFTDAAYIVAAGSITMFPIQRMQSRRCIIDRAETET
jgi:hypothetical protein